MLGVFRVATGALGGKTASVTTGDLIEFGKNVSAKVLLSYGNSLQKQSVNNGGSTELFSEKQMYDAWSYHYCSYLNLWIAKAPILQNIIIWRNYTICIHT